MAYATYDDVQARNPYRTLGASTKPSTTNVTTWIGEAEAIIDGILSATGLTSPCVNTGGIKILRNKVTSYVTGLVKQAYANAGGDGGDDGQKEIDAFEAFIMELATDSVKWGGILQAGAAGDSAIKARSHVTNNADSLTVSNGDFEPEYEKGDLL